jgi:hypothetical protein
MSEVAIMTDIDFAALVRLIRRARKQTLPPLAQGEPQESERRITLPVPDDFVSDGRYSFYCTLSLFP